MKLHNALTRSVDNLKPLVDKQLSIYSCGPTVYDHVHIGNLRTYVFEDTLRRVLKSAGYSVKHVMNITDVDDKTIKRSREEFPDEEPLAALKKLTSRYEQIFYDDARRVGIDLSDSRIVRATQHIEEMKQLINKIPNKYVGDDGVYYDIAKDSDYGVLVKLDHGHERHRIDNDEYDKDHVADFALWKKQTEDEPAWDFEIEGQNIAGRPGWHIECSAMSVKYLGQPFDIHTGGVDLIFPHHENEIAQSRAANGKPLANFFVHAEHLLVDGKKMSKSLNNFYTLDDIRAKGFDSLALRLLFLQAHYRSQLNFTWESLEAARNSYKNLLNWASLRFQDHKSERLKINYAEAVSAIERELSDDMNTPNALSVLYGMVARTDDLGIDSNAIANAAENIDELLGLRLMESSLDITNEQKNIVTEREEAREAKDWQKADELRDKLKGQGIEINDTEHGPVWSRV